MKRILISIALSLATLIAAVGSGYSADLSLGIDGGISFVAGRSYGDYFDAGYAVGGSLFYPVHGNISLGGNVRYQSWNAKTRPYDWTRADGSASVLTVLPAVRFQVSPESYGGLVLFFLQIGAGYASLDSDAVSWMIPDLPEDPVGPKEPIIYSQDNAALSVGAGVSIETGLGFDLEFLPVFDYMFTDDDALMYISVDLGLSIKI